MKNVPMTAETYRKMAQDQRAIASATALPMVRERHIRAAHRWDFLAQEADALQVGLLALFADSGRAAERSYS